MTGSPIVLDEPGKVSNWTGWIAFGAAMLMLLGLIHLMQGFVSLLDDGYYLTAPDGLAVHISFTTLGWLQICLGVLSILIGIGMLMGNSAALVAGVIIAAASAIAHVATIAAYPGWALVVIAFDVVVIYSVLAHGRDMKRVM
jgi:hypothetical protein